MLCGQTLSASRSIYKHMHTATETLVMAAVAMHPVSIMTKHWIEWYMVDFPTLFSSPATRK